MRVSDGRMSGTAYGTVALHVAPEAAVGGPLALVRDGDLIELDVEAGRLDLLVPDEVLAPPARRMDGAPPRQGVDGGGSTPSAYCRRTWERTWTSVERGRAQQ